MWKGATWSNGKSSRLESEIDLSPSPVLTSYVTLGKLVKSLVFHLKNRARIKLQFMVGTN